MLNAKLEIRVSKASFALPLYLQTDGRQTLVTLVVLHVTVRPDAGQGLAVMLHSICPCLCICQSRLLLLHSLQPDSALEVGSGAAEGGAGLGWASGACPIGWKGKLPADRTLFGWGSPGSCVLPMS